MCPNTLWLLFYLCWDQVAFYRAVLMLWTVKRQNSFLLVFVKSRVFIWKQVFRHIWDFFYDVMKNRCIMFKGSLNVSIFWACRKFQVDQSQSERRCFIFRHLLGFQRLFGNPLKWCRCFLSTALSAGQDLEEPERDSQWLIMTRKFRLQWQKEQKYLIKFFCVF